MSYKQSTPNEQIIAIMSGIAGYASNIRDGIYGDHSVKELASYIVDSTEEICELARMTQEQFDAIKKTQGE